MESEQHMSLYRKKPVTVEARQLVDDLHNHADIAAWIESAGGQALIPFAEPCLYIETLEGRMRADIGDWIIKGVKGEFYPCKPDIFEATYESADAPAASPELATAVAAASDTRTYGEIFQRAHGGDSWANLGPAGQACVQAGAEAVAMDVMRRWHPPELAAAMAENRQLRDQLAAAVNPTAADYDHAAEILKLCDLVAEMCAVLAEYGEGGQDNDQIVQWRQRAGLTQEEIR